LTDEERAMIADMLTRESDGCRFLVARLSGDEPIEPHEIARALARRARGEPVEDVFIGFPPREPIGATVRINRPRFAE
jgi:hypothetical protein